MLHYLNFCPSRIRTPSIWLSFVIISTSGWGCASKPPHSNLPKGIVLVVERRIKKRPTNKCELHIGIINNTQSILGRRHVRYKVWSEDVDKPIAIEDYQKDHPLKPGQAGDKKQFIANANCETDLTTHFLKLEVQGLFGRTFEPEKKLIMPVTCEDVANTRYPTYDCKKSILDLHEG